jgi:small GTP-binding protein
MNFLTKKQRNIIAAEKLLLSSSSIFLSSINGDKVDLDLLKDTLAQLDELFLVVVAGEYNSGKTAFINTLLGDSFLKTGITPTTDMITILKYGDSQQKKIIEPGKSLMELPVPLLKDVHIVDTPGTNAILREHESLTTDFIPRSDIVIFITSIDRPFTESERGFLEKIIRWGKKIIFVINKIDIVENQADLLEVVNYVSINAQKLLGFSPVIFTISAKDSLAKLKLGIKDDSLAKIEKYIHNTLDQKERINIKLNNPLHILENLTRKYDEINQANINLIQEDKSLLDNIQNQISLFREDSLRRFQFRYADIDNAILEFEKRGHSFFEETFRVGRIFDLLNKERIQREYKDAVVKDLAIQIDNKVDDLIEWLVDENYKQWHIVNNKINKRMSVFKKSILSDPHSIEIQVERKKIISSVKRESQRVVEKFNRDAEAQQIAEDAQLAVAASAAIEVGALGLGTLVTILATTASADLTGILLAGLTATLGFFIIPNKKKQVIKLFSEKVHAIRNQLSISLKDEITRQIDYVIDNIQETIAPYERFIRAENQKLINNSDQFENSRREISQLRIDIENI